MERMNTLIDVLKKEITAGKTIFKDPVLAM